MVEKTAIYLLTGFLGAGKTTLLQTLLRYIKTSGRRPAVLMNEFGKASVDTLLLEHTAVPVVDLIEGCVCCSVRGSLTAAMAELLDTYQPDVVFLEATGVAIPLEIVDALLDEPLHSRVQIAGVLTVVDATQFPVHLPPVFEQTAMQQTMLEQVRHADVLLLSKTDIARPDRRFAVESMLRGLNANAPLMKVVKGNVDAEALLSIRTRHEQGQGGRGKAYQFRPRVGAGCSGGVDNAEHGVQDGQRSPGSKDGKVVRSGLVVKPTLRPVERKTSFGQLQTMHYTFRSAVDTERLYAFLRELPNSLLRAKGFYRDAESGEVYEFHHVPHTPMLSPVAGTAPEEMFAVLIGEGLAEQELRRKLRACEV